MSRKEKNKADIIGYFKKRYNGYYRNIMTIAICFSIMYEMLNIGIFGAASENLWIFLSMTICNIIYWVSIGSLLCLSSRKLEPLIMLSLTIISFFVPNYYLQIFELVDSAICITLLLFLLFNRSKLKIF